VLERVEGDDTLLKHDFVRNCTEACAFGAGKALGKFVFHPSSPDSAEDDGVLMGFVYDRLTDPQRVGHYRRATPSQHREHQVAASSSRRISRQLGAEHRLTDRKPQNMRRTSQGSRRGSAHL